MEGSLWKSGERKKELIMYCGTREMWSLLPASGTELLKHLELSEKYKLFCSNEATVGRPLDSFWIGLVTKTATLDANPGHLVSESTGIVGHQ